MKPHGRPIQLDGTPLQLLARLSPTTRVLMLHSGRVHRTWARYTLLGFPTLTYQFDQAGQSQLHGAAESFKGTGDPFDDLRQVCQQYDKGIWIGHMSYDVGRWVETVPTQAQADRNWPVMQWGYCPGYLLYDHLESTWYACGDEKALPKLDGPPLNTNYGVQPAKSVFTRWDYEQAVQQCIDYIHAGDVFQVNLTQRFTAEFTGQYPLSQRAMFISLMQHSPAWYAAYLEQMDQRCIASSSPELFLQVSPQGHILTRPIKGTAPASEPVTSLQQSIKDQAELHMIVDLMRNDLGRVCKYGSIHVTDPRTIESHPTVHHGVATIEGDLTQDHDVFDLLRAALPGGSITGAPKVRAMQIIDELEPVRRGPYCGCIGYLSAEHGHSLNIAIRTMLIEQLNDAAGRIDYSVGGGIVSDSIPSHEYEETRIKARGIEAALGF